MERLFLFLAGVDKDKLDQCPSTDKIWAYHIGAMLSLTFIVIFSITYLSFDYIGSINTRFDVDTNKILVSEVERGFGTFMLGIMIASTLALLITLFDRAIFQSDWFYQPTYLQTIAKHPVVSLLNILAIGSSVIALFILAYLFFFGSSLGVLQRYFPIMSNEKNTVWVVSILIVIFLIAFFSSQLISYYSKSSRTTNVLPEPTIVGRFIRVSVRLVISICLAYVLSVFLELRLYESNILTVLSDKHYSINKDLYDKFDNAIVGIQQTLDSKKKLISDNVELINKLTKASKEDIMLLLGNIDSDLLSIQNDTNNRISQLRNSGNTILNKLRANVLTAETEVKDITHKITEFKQRRIDEEFGTSFSGLDKLSGVDGVGKNANSSTGHADVLNDSLIIANDFLANRKTELLNEEKRQKDAFSLIDREHKAKLGLITNRQNIIATSSASDEEKLAKHLEIANTTLTKNQADLDTFLNAKNSEVARLKKTLEENPKFKPFRAGPIERFTALESIKSDSEVGESITIFSLWIKVFVIFLEVIPVITKIFFSPPSTYSALVKAEVLSRVKKVIDETKADLNSNRSYLNYSSIERKLASSKKYEQLLSNLVKQAEKTFDKIKKLNIVENKIEATQAFHEEMLKAYVQEVVKDSIKKEAHAKTQQ